MKIEVKPSKIGGKGAHATAQIPSGETITPFEGQELPNAEVKRLQDAGQLGRDDSLQIDVDFYIVPDGTHPSYFINHSCEPNAAVRNRNQIIAVRDILPDEEITYDYSMVVGNEVDWSMPCNCDVAQCRKIVANWESIPLETLKKYIARGIMQNFMRKQIAARYPIYNK